MIFGITEEPNHNRQRREERDRMEVSEVLKVLQEEGQNLEGEIEEIYRIGRYNDEKRNRPLKVRLSSQRIAEDILTKTGKLSKTGGLERVWVKRDLNNEERNKEKELRKEAKDKNERLTEDEKKRFFWRVVDMRMRKWYLKRPEEQIEERV